MASSPTVATSTDINNRYDVVVIGAGLSGINLAYRLRTRLPHLSFVVLEARDNIGGTWDLYRYPGARCDSEIYVQGFAWHPWSIDRPLPTGEELLEYMSDAVSKHRLDRFIRLGHRVSSAEWSTADKSWTLSVATEDHKTRSVEASWLIQATGYFDFESPQQPDIPRLESFSGKVVNPQFWPAELDYTGKKVAVIGSGATAVSLLPALPGRASHVMMIQRSPTYITASANTAWAHRFLPRPLVDVFRFIRYLIMPYLVVLLCQYFPDFVREDFRKATIGQLPKHIDFDTHFKPRYNPWEQRICVDADGAFYKALHLPNVKFITGEIKSVGHDAITMQSGETVPVDIIVTATGPRMRLGGKVALRVDGEPVSWGRRYVWNGAMLDAVPNMMFTLGYTNHALTLGADNTAALFTRLWKYMEKRGLDMARPRITPDAAAAGTRRLWQLDSTYALEAERSGELPVYGVTGNWRPRNRPPIDYVKARWGDYTSGLEFAT
ncbi:FAD/NAD(P)-binding domain-containing protein [Xylariaceae sp. FL0594]|nr:FAD/NAD(P)-binding domain-containing protein [Xylariaceae sp. FL0594]